MNLNLEIINTGSSANDGNGDSLRLAFYKSHFNDSLLDSSYSSLSGELSLLESNVSSLSGDLSSSLYSLSGDIYSFNNNLIASGNFLESKTSDNLNKINLLSGAVQEISGYIQNL